MKGNMNKPRLMSLDALRGFDMFFITGGSGIIVGLCEGLGFGGCWIARQMSHVPWTGIAHHDTIFPLFLFLAGVSWPFSLASQEAMGRTSWMIHRKVLLRMVTLFVLGMIIGDVLKFGPSFRIPSVLGQIGLSWGFAALLFMHVRKPIPRWFSIAVVLVAYWVLLAFTGAPDAPIGADLYAKEWNVISWLDRTVMPNHIYVKRVYDPESLFSVPAGVALAMLGMMAGSILRSAERSGESKAFILILLSGVMLLSGLIFVLVLKMPIVKALWTSSFVLFSAAYSFFMLAVFYWIIDVKGWCRWTLNFRVIGMNSILIYVLMMIGVLSTLQAFFFGGLSRWVGYPWSPVVVSAGQLAIGWMLLYFFYRKGIFMKV